MTDNAEFMKNKCSRACWLCFTSLAAFIVVSGNATSVAQTLTRHWVTAYYGAWELGTGSNGYLPVSKVDFTAMTDVVHFALVPNPDGSLDTASNDVTLEGGEALIKAAHAVGTEVLISIGGWSTESGFLGATSSSVLNKFVSNIVAFVKGRGYDGVDIDWEPLQSSDGPNFKALMKNLRAALGRSYIITSTAGDPSVMASVQSYVDQINIMTYDMSGPWGGWVSWYNSPIFNDSLKFPGLDEYVPSVDESVKEYEDAGIPTAKLGIGAEFGGTIWKGVDLPDQLLSTVLSVQFDVPLYDGNGDGIMQKYFKPEYYHWDPGAQSGYLSIPGLLGIASEFISYDDSNSLAAKAQYIKKNGLGGIILYELGMGYPGNGSYPLLNSVKSDYKPFLQRIPPGVNSAAILNQNYPNPFSKWTEIRFTTYISGMVTLTVYNVLGQLISTLVNGHLPAGTHTVQWSGFGHPSGVYLCVLRIDSGYVTRKMLLLK